MVESVQRLAELEHHVVRHVHYKPQRPHAAKLKPLSHQFRRGAIFDIGNDARRVARALLRVFHNDLYLAFDRNIAFREVHGGQFHLAPEDCAELARDADYGKRVGAVPGDFDIKDRLRLFAADYVADKCARRRLRREVNNARMVGAVAEFAVGATHAKAFHTAQLALLDFEAALGNDCPDFRQRRLHSLAGIRRAADYLPGFLAVCHL